MIPQLGFKRFIALKPANFGRITRETIRDRFNKQKDFYKPHNAQNGGMQNGMHADSIPVRPHGDLLKALGFTVVV